MNPLKRSGKMPTWLVALGGLVLAAVGPWGASTLWQVWKPPPSNSLSPFSDASTGGVPLQPQGVGTVSNPPLQGGQLSPDNFPLPTHDVSAPAQAEGGSPDAAAFDGKTPHSQQTLSFDELFRFDLTIRDVVARWPRVSTSLADLQLQGYRVPVVTGPSETDLAGALTYYFNSYQQLQRITFQGTTGDGRELVQFLASRYGFQRRLTNDPSLFVYEVPRLGGPPQSVLRLKLAPTLKADRPHQRFDVWLVIERPEEPPKPFWERLGLK